MKALDLPMMNPGADAPLKGQVDLQASPADFIGLFSQLLATQSAGAPMANALTAQLQAALGNHGVDGDERQEVADLAALMAALGMVAAPAQLKMPALDGFASGAQSAGGQTALWTDTKALLAVETLKGALQSGSMGSPEQGTMPAEVSAPTIDQPGASATVNFLREPVTSQHEVVIPRQIHAPMGTRAWADELGAHVHWMTERGHHSACIRLSPEHLGPLEIRIAVRDEQASVWFGAAHADTRAAIEGALPRLREMLASQGLALNDGGVFQESSRQQPRSQHSPAVAGDPIASPENAVASQRMALALIDAYA